jgi:hypothetical protein
MPKRTDPGTLTEVKQAAVVDLGGKERAENLFDEKTMAKLERLL